MINSTLTVTRVVVAVLLIEIGGAAALLFQMREDMAATEGRVLSSIAKHHVSAVCMDIQMGRDYSPAMAAAACYPTEDPE